MRINGHSVADFKARRGLKADATRVVSPSNLTSILLRFIFTVSQVEKQQ